LFFHDQLHRLRAPVVIEQFFAVRHPLEDGICLFFDDERALGIWIAKVGVRGQSAAA
jgi:hypothetical protein